MESSIQSVLLFNPDAAGTPIMLDLHKFMVAISRFEVNHDGYGGTDPDAMMGQW